MTMGYTLLMMIILSYSIGLFMIWAAWGRDKYLVMLGFLYLVTGVFFTHEFLFSLK